MRLIEVSYSPLGLGSPQDTHKIEVAARHIVSFEPLMAYADKFCWLHLSDGNVLFMTKEESMRVAQLVRETSE